MTTNNLPIIEQHTCSIYCEEGAHTLRVLTEVDLLSEPELVAWCYHARWERASVLWVKPATEALEAWQRDLKARPHVWEKTASYDPAHVRAWLVLYRCRLPHDALTGCPDTSRAMKGRR